jgi:hypothetical protein
VYPTELMNQLTDRAFASVAPVLSFIAEAGELSDRLLSLHAHSHILTVA